MMHKVCMIDYCKCIRFFRKLNYNDLDLARTFMSINFLKI